MSNNIISLQTQNISQDTESQEIANIKEADSFFVSSWTSQLTPLGKLNS
jgi:hypothetical protein